jgi:hypothetical protein
MALRPSSSLTPAGLLGATPRRLPPSGAGGPLRRVVPPGRHFGVSGAAVPATDAWATPLGSSLVDLGLRRAAVAAGALVDDRPHRPEHSIEVQLPFLQTIGGSGLAILPVAMGRMTAAAAADLLGPLMATADLVVVSTDLSHYHDQRPPIDSMNDYRGDHGRRPERHRRGFCVRIFARGHRRAGPAPSVAGLLLDRASGRHGRRSRPAVGYAALSIG